MVRALAAALLPLAISAGYVYTLFWGPEHFQELAVKTGLAAMAVLAGVFTSILVYAMISRSSREARSIKDRVDAELERARREAT